MTQHEWIPPVGPCAVFSESVARVRFDCRVAQLTGEMVAEGWDRRTATAIAREFARAGA
jgi:hypothetical protein